MKEHFPPPKPQHCSPPQSLSGGKMAHSILTPIQILSPPFLCYNLSKIMHKDNQWWFYGYEEGELQWWSRGRGAISCLCEK